MPHLPIGAPDSPANLYYECHGPRSAPAVVLIHGWPLSAAMWERQLPALLDAGYRVIAYDRRGFGRSDQPAIGYDYNTLADDLHQVITRLRLKDVTLVGFSMGGGEVARYIGKRGSKRVSRAVYIGAIPPFLLKTADNPTGVPGKVFDGIKAGLAADRPAFLAAFFKNFYNTDTLKARISDDAIRMNWNIAVGASPRGTINCVDAWLTDFRPDLARHKLPTLIIHGDADRIVPHAATAVPMSKLIKGSRLVTIKDAPHGLTWTHPEEVNRALLKFLGDSK